MPSFPALLARWGRYTVLVLVGFLLLWGAAWQGWIFRSDRQYVPREPKPADIAVPSGYKVEVLASGLNAPSILEVTPDGTIYFSESGYGGAYAATAGYEGLTPGRVMRLNRDGSLTAVAGDFNAPLDGFFHDPKGNLWVSHRGMISVVTPQGRRDVVTGLPSLGDHKNNEIAMGPDGKLYIAQGTVTSAGIVGLDNWVLWGRFFPGLRDIPCKDLTLRGVNVKTADPRSVVPFMKVTTGAFSPFGQATHEGQVVKGELPCSGSVMRVNPDGTDLELVAWGLRNPTGLRFDKTGQLYVTDNGPDTRGSRSMEGPDLLHRIAAGAWYGWPDYWNGVPASQLSTAGREKPEMLLARPPQKPSPAFFAMEQHAAPVGFDFAPAGFGFEGQVFVAQFGTAFPATSTHPSPTGFNVVRVDPVTRKEEVFARNVKAGPASINKGMGGFERPVSVRFGPDGAMYVLDWGHLAVTRKGPWHTPYSGVLWRISKAGTAALPYRYKPPVAHTPFNPDALDGQVIFATGLFGAAGWLLWQRRSKTR